MCDGRRLCTEPLIPCLLLKLPHVYEKKKGKSLDCNVQSTTQRHFRKQEETKKKEGRMKEKKNGGRGRRRGGGIF